MHVGLPVDMRDDVEVVNILARLPPRRRLLTTMPREDGDGVALLHHRCEIVCTVISPTGQSARDSPCRLDLRRYIIDVEHMFRTPRNLDVSSLEVGCRHWQTSGCRIEKLKMQNFVTKHAHGNQVILQYLDSP